MAKLNMKLEFGIENAFMLEDGYTIEMIAMVSEDDQIPRAWESSYLETQPRQNQNLGKNV